MFVEGGFVLFGSVFDVLDLSVVSFVYLRQLITRYNDCHYRDDERSISPKKIGKAKKDQKEAPTTSNENQEENKNKPSPEDILLTLRVQVDSCSPAALLALTTILLGGTPATYTNRLLWIQAVRDHFDNVPLFVSNCKQLQLVFDTATQAGYEVHQAGLGGGDQGYDLVVLLQGAVPFREGGLHLFFRAGNEQEDQSTAAPQLVNIDCTGLGGHDLEGFKDYDICIRTDKHGQSIYAPSVSPLESAARDGEMHICLVALGGSKAMHEFLVLHHMATDSAEAWDNFLDLCLPHCTWVRAGSRRALALHMFDKYHIAPLIENLPILCGSPAWSWC